MALSSDVLPTPFVPITAVTSPGLADEIDAVQDLALAVMQGEIRRRSAWFSAPDRHR